MTDVQFGYSTPMEVTVTLGLTGFAGGGYIDGVGPIRVVENAPRKYTKTKRQRRARTGRR